MACALLFAAQMAAGQQFPIGIIDFYGLRSVSADAVRGALTVHVGDTLTITDDGLPAVIRESERLVGDVPGVERARIDAVCCDAGRLILFVGVEETGHPAPAFGPAPSGSVRLPADIVDAGRAFEAALIAVLQTGDTVEDDSRGHALNHAPGLRAVQEQYIGFARRDDTRLQRVLHESSDAEQRALAALVLGYVGDKQAVVPDLLAGLADPDSNVRNNALRSLSVFTRITMAPALHVPYEPIVGLLNSAVWTDRDKALLALDPLSRRRNSDLLSILRRNALDSLVEMGRWQSKGYAVLAFHILGRLAGRSEAEIDEAWTRGAIEAVIADVRARASP
jgi:hypothetical protein